MLIQLYLREAVNALSYPRSSQRFLEKGQAQLETEIKYLQQNALVSPPKLLTKQELSTCKKSVDAGRLREQQP